MEQYYRAGRKMFRRWMLYLLIGATVVSLMALLAMALDDDDDDGREEPAEPDTPPAKQIDLDGAEPWRSVINGIATKPAPFRRAKVPPAPAIE